MKTIRAVLFDLDDTLIIDEAVSRYTFEHVAAEAVKCYGVDPVKFAHSAKSSARSLWAEGPAHPYCRRIGISAFECLWGKFEGDTADLTCLREWSRSFRVAVFESALRDQAIEPDDADELDLSVKFSDARRKFQRLMPDVREVLTRLKSKALLGLLTNGAPDLQREKLAASGLASFFQAVAISGEHDIGKPRPEIFHRLLSELGVSADEAVMVGNSMERDIAGAANAGITNIWIQVAGAEEPDNIVPDYTIHGLAELPALIERIQK